MNAPNRPASPARHLPSQGRRPQSRQGPGQPRHGHAAEDQTDRQQRQGRCRSICGPGRSRSRPRLSPEQSQAVRRTRSPMPTRTKKASWSYVVPVEPAAVDAAARAARGRRRALSTLFPPGFRSRRFWVFCSPYICSCPRRMSSSGATRAARRSTMSSSATRRSYRHPWRPRSKMSPKKSSTRNGWSTSRSRTTRRSPNVKVDIKDEMTEGPDYIKIDPRPIVNFRSNAQPTTLTSFGIVTTPSRALEDNVTVRRGRLDELVRPCHRRQDAAVRQGGHRPARLSAIHPRKGRRRRRDRIIPAKSGGPSRTARGSCSSRKSWNVLGRQPAMIDETAPAARHRALRAPTPEETTARRLTGLGLRIQVDTHIHRRRRRAVHGTRLAWVGRQVHRFQGPQGRAYFDSGPRKARPAKARDDRPHDLELGADRAAQPGQHHAVARQRQSQLGDPGHSDQVGKRCPREIPR